MNKHQIRAYTAYGHATIPPSERTLLGFNGEYPDDLAKLYILGSGYRGYRAGLMRFVSPDSLSPFAEGGINAYSYCGNDPINNIDPSGHVGVRLNIARRQPHTRSQLLIQFDSPAQVNARSRQDAPPHYASHPQAFSTAGAPPSYNPGKLPGYSEQLPPGHQRVIAPTLSKTGKFLELPAPPKYNQLKARPQIQDALPPAQAQAYQARLQEMNGRYSRLKNVIRRLERGNMYIPDEYRRNLDALRQDRNRIRNLLGL
ncbi:RHS repeat-associated core domain-containing protein [Pseudomonas sp. WOUb67]|uniref:RHS repeat-associated core domain-containing protein n=1 Tax=Pseudomonas sp. WOUb67 TaxID=3161136 RepID=UPI003CEBE941